jgi:prepilin-type N-terminal cleavage/methylation domain-containing protein
MTRNANAFSLVELSIVLVILGLLVGGILAGQSLIRASELRSVIAEQSRWLTATQAFRDKYFALPGDMSNATSIWGKDSTYCSSHPGSVGTPGTCNGNGNGQLYGGGANSTGEMYQYWKQLVLAGLMEGTYTGIGGSAGEPVIGTNSPPAKLSPAGWSATYFDNSDSGSASMWALNDGNMFIFGGQNTGNWNSTNTLRTQELWNIDTKLDDGKPAAGKVISYGWFGCTNGANNASFTADYALASSTIACSALFRQQF